MKLLNKTELKTVKNQSAVLAREIDQSLAKKTKELNRFNESYEAQKKQILDDYIQFARQIAGEKALLEAGFATTEERKGHALRSLSALALGADQKLAEAKRLDAHTTELAANVLLKTEKLVAATEALDSREAIVNTKADKVSSDGHTLTILREDFEKSSKVIMGKVEERENRLNRREKILDDRENDIVTTTRSTQAIAESLKNERGSFEKEKVAEWAKLDKERKRDIREIVEAEYQKREAEVSARERGSEIGAKMLREREEKVKNDELSIKAGYVGLEKAVDAHESNVKAKREEYGTREAKLARIEASQRVRDKELEAIVTDIAKREDNLTARETSLRSNTAKEADKTLTRQRELDQIATTLKTRWETNDKANQTRTEALDKRESALDDREAIVGKMEATAKAVLEEATQKSSDWAKKRKDESEALEAHGRVILHREIEVNAKEASVNRQKVANDEEAKQLIERTGREDKRIAEDRRALVDARKTLDRAWVELNNKQHGR